MNENTNVYLNIWTGGDGLGPAYEYLFDSVTFLANCVALQASSVISDIRIPAQILERIKREIHTKLI